MPTVAPQACSGCASTRAGSPARERSTTGYTRHRFAGDRSALASGVSSPREQPHAHRGEADGEMRGRFGHGGDGGAMQAVIDVAALLGVVAGVAGDEARRAVFGRATIERPLHRGRALTGDADHVDRVWRQVPVEVGELVECERSVAQDRVAESGGRKRIAGLEVAVRRARSRVEVEGEIGDAEIVAVDLERRRRQERVGAGVERLADGDAGVILRTLGGGAGGVHLIDGASGGDGRGEDEGDGGE